MDVGEVEGPTWTWGAGRGKRAAEDVREGCVEVAEEATGKVS